MSLTGAVAMAAALSACGSVDPYGSNNYPVSSTSSYPASSYPSTSYPAGTYSQPMAAVEYGRVTDVSLINGPAAPSGNHAAGTVVGNRIAQNQSAPYAGNQTVYRVSVQTDDGQMRTFDVSATGDLRPGDRVRIENGVIYHA
jgi:hypothetical protein